MSEKMISLRCKFPAENYEYLKKCAREESARSVAEYIERTLNAYLPVIQVGIPRLMKIADGEGVVTVVPFPSGIIKTTSVFPSEVSVLDWVLASWERTFDINVPESTYQQLQKMVSMIGGKDFGDVVGCALSHYDYYRRGQIKEYLGRVEVT